MKKIITLSVLICLFTMSGCLPPPEESKNEVTIALNSDVQTFSPTKLSDPAATRVLWQMYEGLVEVDTSGQLIPALATYWSSNEEFTEWTIKLRRGVKFHDNKFVGPADDNEMTSEDVVNSIHEIGKGFGSFLFSGLLEGYEAFLSGEADAISGVYATSKYELKIRLQKPDQAFMTRISSPYLTVFPKYLSENIQPGEEWVPVGTGPYMHKETTVSQTTLVRNPKYWGEAAHIENLIFKVERTPALRNRAFETNQVDIAEIPSTFVLPDQQDIQRLKSFNSHFIGMDNLQLKSSELRLALSLAIDREQIVSNLLRGFAIKTGQPLPSSMQHAPDFTPQSFDLQRAKQLIAELENVPEKLVMAVSLNGQHNEVAQVVAANIAELGIDIEIRLMEYGDLWGTLFSDNKPALFLTNVEWIYSSEAPVLEQLLSTGVPNPNVTSFSNERVDKLLQALQLTSEESKQKKIIQEISRIVTGNPPTIWLYEEVKLVRKNPALEPIQAAPNNHWKLAKLKFN